MRTRKNTKRSKNSRSFKKRNKKTYKKSQSGGIFKINLNFIQDTLFGNPNKHIIKNGERYREPNFLGKLWNKLNEN